MKYYDECQKRATGCFVFLHRLSQRRPVIRDIEEDVGNFLPYASRSQSNATKIVEKNK